MILTKPYHLFKRMVWRKSWLQSIYRPLPANLSTCAHVLFLQRAWLGTDMIGSVKPGPNNISSSIIMANWPSTGNSLDTLTSEQMNIGTVFCSTRLRLCKALRIPQVMKRSSLENISSTSQLVSAKVCLADDLFEPSDACCFIPVQRIYARCAYTLCS